MTGWKIYYWILVILLILGTFGVIVDFQHNSLFDLINVVVMFVCVIAINSYIYKKKYFPSEFWRLFFVVNLVIDIMGLLYNFAPNDPTLQNLAFVNGGAKPSALLGLFATAFDLPVIVAIYRLGKNSPKSRKK